METTGIDEKKRLSFCTTCLKRDPRSVLWANLHSCRALQRDIEFVFVNFVIDEEGERLERWIWQSIPRDYFDSGYFKYFRSTALPQWHACVAKNTAHVAATSPFVINLDADNYVTAEQVEYLLGHPGQLNFIYHGWAHDYRDGTFGHIGMPRALFLELGGYNEKFKPMGYEDNDVLDRATRHRSDLPIVYWTERFAVLNSHADSMAHAPEGRNTTYEKWWIENYSISVKLREAGQLCLDQPHPGVAATLAPPPLDFSSSSTGTPDEPPGRTVYGERNGVYFHAFQTFVAQLHPSFRCRFWAIANCGPSRTMLERFPSGFGIVDGFAPTSVSGLLESAVYASTAWFPVANDGAQRAVIKALELLIPVIEHGERLGRDHDGGIPRGDWPELFDAVDRAVGGLEQLLRDADGDAAHFLGGQVCSLADALWLNYLDAFERRSKHRPPSSRHIDQWRKLCSTVLSTQQCLREVDMIDEMVRFHVDWDKSKQDAAEAADAADKHAS